MRKLLLFGFLLFAFQLAAQKTFSAGIIGGVNGCQIHGDSYSGFNQIGFVAGAFVHNNPGEKWQAQFGIQYSGKGSRHNLPQDMGGYRDFEIRLNYVEVPLLVRYNTRKVFIELGVSFGAMFKVRTWDAYGETTPQDFKRWEFALVNGIGYNLNDYLFIELTTSNSLLPFKNFSVPMYYPRFLPNLFNRGMYNNLLGVMVGFRFGGGSND